MDVKNSRHSIVTVNSVIENDILLILVYYVEIFMTVPVTGVKTMGAALTK